MVLLPFNNVSTCLLVLFILNNCYKDYAADQQFKIENAQFFTNENIQARPEVETPYGRVRGVNMVSYRNRTFYGFKGIPFAQPPVGNLRFKAPEPASPWNGTLDGSKDSNQCPQIDPSTNKFFGEEDCLYLNVYTPLHSHGENSTLLPVMIFIYGGGFKTGTISPKRWGPQFILNKDVVLVVPSYRMGVLGFLSTGDEASPGNYGLKDLVAAMEWNKRNIRYFGGDPGRVTIFGGSSGAISVHLLALSNLTNGLFHRYITDSGTALIPAMPIPKTKIMDNTIQLGTHLGCPTNVSTSLVACLRGINATQLVDSYHLYYKWYNMPTTIWAPTVEPDIEGAFLVDTPRNLIAAGKIRDLPWICNINRDDGIVATAPLYVNQEMQEEVFDQIDYVLSFILLLEGIVKNPTAYIAEVKSYYLNDLSANRTVLMNNLTQLIADCMFTYPGYKGIEEQVIHAENPVYLSSFEYRGTVSYSYFFSNGSTTNWGVAHGDELLYLLPGPDSQFGPPGWKFSETDWGMVDTMVELWTSFANNGTPTISGPNGTVVWEPYSPGKSYLQIGNGPDPVLEIKHGYHEDRMKFWKELDTATTWL